MASDSNMYYGDIGVIFNIEAITGDKITGDVFLLKLVEIHITCKTD